MGQRHQIIVIYPKMFLNQGNGNNKPERAEVIHHQWLYGHSAILSLERIVKLAKSTFESGQTDFLFGRSDNGYTGGDGTRAIAAAVSVDPENGYYHNVSIWEDADWNEMKGDWVEPQKLEPGMFDNNDGVTLIRFVTGDPKPRYAFITPSHLEGKHWKDSSGYGPWSAQEYLEFYYSKEDQAAWDLDVRDAIQKSLNFISKNSWLMTAKEIFELLPKFKIRPALTRKPKSKINQAKLAIV